MLAILKSILGSIALSFLKKRAPEMLVDAFTEIAEKGASLTETKWDDKRVAEFKEDRADHIKIIRGLIG